LTGNEKPKTQELEINNFINLMKYVALGMDDSLAVGLNSAIRLLQR